MVKKEYVLVLAALLSLPACHGPRKKKATTKKHKKRHMKVADAHIPLTEDSAIRSVFDEDMDMFTDEDLYAQGSQDSEAYRTAQVDTKNVYFDFGKQGITPEQEAVIEENIAIMQDVVSQAEERGEQATVIVEAHSCSSAGTAAYNMVLSERRAKQVADRFEAAGIEAKVVGRGAEIPAMDEYGMPVEGDRNAQAVNRRAEIHVLYS